MWATWRSAAWSSGSSSDIGLSVDAQYTHVPGIIGAGGISKEAGETDLGGMAARFKVLIGR